MTQEDFGLHLEGIQVLAEVGKVLVDTASIDYDVEVVLRYLRGSNGLKPAFMALAPGCKMWLYASYLNQVS